MERRQFASVVIRFIGDARILGSVSVSVSVTNVTLQATAKGRADDLHGDEAARDPAAIFST